MDLESMFVSHWWLRNPAQVAGMVEAIRGGSLLPPITVARWDDGPSQVIDGHHRAVAYWLAGIRNLGWGEYVLLEDAPFWAPQRGTVPELVERFRQGAAGRKR